MKILGGLLIAIFLFGCGPSKREVELQSKLDELKALQEEKNTEPAPAPETEPKPEPKPEPKNLISGIDQDISDALIEKILREAKNYDKIQMRGEENNQTAYLPNSTKPFKGWVKATDGDGQLSFLMQMKDGKMKGTMMNFYENGQINGFIYAPNGIPSKETKKKIQTKQWYKNGQLKLKGFSYDVMFEVDVWKPDGTSCEITDLRNGNGKWVDYDDDGDVRIIRHIKDGIDVTEEVEKLARKKQEEEEAALRKKQEEVMLKTMVLPNVMKGRCNSSDRIARLTKAGGKASMDKQVLKALRWLKIQQQPEGNFGTKFPVAMTAFALLAYSGHCETVDSPEFGETVKKAIAYLVNVADKGKGMMATSRDRHVSYEHGIAVYALADAYSMNKSASTPFPRISPILKKAVAVIIEGQTNGGGWLYSYGSNGIGDLSVSGWNVQALKGAQLTGIKFSGLETAIKKAVRYLKAAEDPNGTDGYWKYRVQDGQKGKLSLTGVGAFCARILGVPSQLENKALDLINSKNPKKFNANAAYSWYYYSRAAFQKQGKHWNDFNKSYQEVIAAAQEKDGSWPPSSGHGYVAQDGEIYSTALCTLMLEVYYRYLPTVK